MKRLLRSAGDFGAAGHPVRPGAGLRGAILQRPADHGDRRLLARRRLRHLRPADGPPHAANTSPAIPACRDQHAGRRQQRRGRAYLQRRAEGRHLHRRAAEQRHHGRAVRRAARQRPAAAPRRDQADPHRLRHHRSLRLHRARRRADQDLQAGADAGVPDRRQPARHLDPRLSGDAQQHHRRQDQAGQRLSGHARDHAGDREERGARLVRLFLVEPEGAEAGLDQVRLHPRHRAGARQGQSGDQQDGRAAGRGFRHFAGEPQDHGADLFVGNLRPPVSDGAGCAGRPGRGAAQGVHGDDERTRTCWPRRSGSGSPSTRSRARTCRSLPPRSSRRPMPFVEKTKDALVYRAP